MTAGDRRKVLWLTIAVLFAANLVVARVQFDLMRARTAIAAERPIVKDQARHPAMELKDQARHPAMELEE